MIVLDAETRSLERASIVMKRVVGLDVSANTIERIAEDVNEDDPREQLRRVIG